MNPLAQSEMSQIPTESTQPTTDVQTLFEKQRSYFATDVTKTYEWRIDQLDRLIRMLKDNYQRFADASRRDFKTASQENVFEVSAPIATAEFVKSQLKEWMRPVEAPLPKLLAASGHKGMVYREPYGVTLIICPFNGPLLLSLRPAVAALSAGNPCILKLSEALLATDELLLELIPKYFEPEAVTVVFGAREVVTKLLELPLDFMFLTGSVGAGKAAALAARSVRFPSMLRLYATLLQEVCVQQTKHCEFGSFLDRRHSSGSGDSISPGNCQRDSWLVSGGVEWRKESTCCGLLA
jgi:aldehyde dehydrogenase (NAD+)